MPTCLFCGNDFTAKSSRARFCPEKPCKDNFWNREKTQGIKLPEKLRGQLQSLAQAHNIPINEMACMIFQQALNPDGKPLEDSEIYGSMG